MALPPDYIALIEKLARVFTEYRERTGFSPVLVGGAAAAIMTAGNFMSSDFDIIAASDEEFAAAMISTGFVREDGPFHLLGGWYHPDHPSYGLELVSGRLFDGRAARDRLIEIRQPKGDEIILPSYEDLIADRLGQYAAGRSSDTELLEQARMIYAMAMKIDFEYLSQRVTEESGDISLLGDLDKSA